MENINKYIAIDCLSGSAADCPGSESREEDAQFVFQFNLSAAECFFDLSQPNRRVEIRVRQDYFDKYEERFTPALGRQTICCNTQAKLYELINCELRGIRRRIFLESAALHLISQLIHRPFETACDTCTVAPPSPLGEERINQIKEYIVENISKNLTIPIIASYAGINQCYLKRGFKSATGQTIFDFVQQNRMAKAKHLLQNTNMQIADVALEVGYSSLSSFSQAFKNTLGVNPRDYAKADFPNN